MGFTLPSSSDDGPRQQARILMDRKQSIEAEIAEQMSILTANGCDMSTPLVDGEGFPRADIDLWAVRTARVRIIELRNDFNATINAIAKALEGVFDPNLVPPHGSNAEAEDLKPFARVDGVSPNSPASQAGLQREDLIIKFGHLTSKSITSSMQPVAELVAANENSHVIIRVLRSGQTVYLTLIPKRGWGGRGLIGCHIVPYSS
ncbi:hypothetical protein JOM56_010693 [Amanita muscaria]|uniref:Probable 26S proteasome regulatory subunit p27 n=1 Tax=Amanita muscaria (strain Koide BX008) TaxID=946122 RepID=A0A0C2X3B9_AMAMK|nr:hypothetical protein M378DRAFT_722590 [Amanita muscaria Koide BX008]